jgi:nucleotide-binding universal stress UspA family protein
VVDQHSSGYQRIAIALDSPEASQPALRWGVTLARSAACPLDLVHVAYSQIDGQELGAVSTKLDEEIAQREKTARTRLKTIEAEIAAVGTKVRSMVLHGPPGPALSEYAHENRPDLIVMSTHDRRRLERLLLGGSTDQVIAESGAPILVLHDQEPKAPLTAPVQVSRMLIPLNGSDFAEAILPHAERLARLLGSSVTLLGVVQSLIAAVLAGGLGGTMEASLPPPTLADTRAERTEFEMRAISGPAG